jgi:hypothetical protein
MFFFFQQLSSELQTSRHGFQFPVGVRDGSGDTIIPIHFYSLLILTDSSNSIYIYKNKTLDQYIEKVDTVL